MSSYGSQAEAYAYGTIPVRRAPERGQVRLGVIEGGGLDAEARRSVSVGFVRILRVVALAVALVVGLGAIRVAITCQTVGCLQNNLELRSDISEAEGAYSDLKIERSVLSSSSRITRIATENYGMVYAANHDRIALPPQELGTSEKPVDEPAAAGEHDEAPLLAADAALEPMN